MGAETEVARHPPQPDVARTPAPVLTESWKSGGVAQGWQRTQQSASPPPDSVHDSHVTLSPELLHHLAPSRARQGAVLHMQRSYGNSQTCRAIERSRANPARNHVSSGHEAHRTTIGPLSSHPGPLGGTTISETEPAEHLEVESTQAVSAATLTFATPPDARQPGIQRSAQATPGIQRGFLDTLGDAADAVSDVASSAANKVADVASDAAGVVADTAGAVAGAVSDAASSAVDAVAGLLDGVVGQLKSAFEAITGQINSVWETVRTGVTKAVDFAIQQASSFLGGIGSLFSAVGAALSALDADSLKVVWAGITGAANAALAGVRALVSQVTSSVDGLWNGLKGLAQGLISGLRGRAEGLIGRLPGAVQGAARSLWNTIEKQLTAAWKAIETTWTGLRETALKSVNKIVTRVEGVATRLKNSVVSKIIQTLEQVKGLFAFMQKVMENPDILIDPIVQEVVGRLQGLPEKAKSETQTRAQEQASSGPGSAGPVPAAATASPTTAAPAASINRTIRRNAPAAGVTRSTMSFKQVVSTCWDAVTDKLAALWGNLWNTVKEMVIGVLHPGEIWKGLKSDWEQMTKDLSTRASRFESIRTDSWDGFWEDLGRFLSNLADFPLIVWRTANAMLGRLSVWIGIALVLGGAVAGAIAVGTGGAVFGSVVPAAGTAAGAGIGVVGGAWAGAQAGYAVAETVGLVLLASFLAGEQISIVKALNDLLWIPQTDEEQKEDVNQSTDSAIAMGTALLLMAIAFIGNAIAKRVWAFVKNISARLRPKVVEPTPPAPKPVEVDPAGPKPGEVDPAGPKPGETPPGKIDQLVICRVCDIVPGVPKDLMDMRAKLTPEMRLFLDQRAAGFFPDPANPTPANFKALRGFMEGTARKGGGDLEAGLRKIAPKPKPVGTPHGAAVAELPRVRSAVEKLIQEIEDFAKANPDKETINRSATRMREQLDGPIADMENGRVEATPDQINTVDRAIKGGQGELERAKTAPSGTKFSEVIDGAEIDQVHPDGKLVQIKKMRALRNPSRTFDETVAQIKRTLQIAQNNPVGGKPRQVAFDFPEGLSKEVAADLRAVSVNGQSATINAAEIIVPPK